MIMYQGNLYTGMKMEGGKPVCKKCGCPKFFPQLPTRRGCNGLTVTIDLKCSQCGHMATEERLLK